MADRSISVRLRADVSQYMANIRRAGLATSELERDTLNVERAFRDLEDAEDRVRAAQARLTEVQKSGRASASQLAQAQENLAAAVRDHERAQRAAVVVGMEFAEKHQDIADGADESTRALGRFGGASDRVARRANFQFNALVALIGASLPAASAVATSALVGGLGVAFGALGAVGLRNSEALRSAWSDLGDTLSQDLAADAGVLEGEFVGAADRIEESWNRLRPQLREAFAGAAPLVSDFAGSVTDLAEFAMPGLVTAIGNVGPVMSGFRTLAGQVGATAGDFVAELSKASDEAGTGLYNLGRVIDELARGATPILTDLTRLWADHGESVAEVIGSLLDVLSEVSGGALPLFSAGLTVAAQVLSVVLDVIEPIAPALGVMASAWVVASTAAKGMNAVAPILNRASSAVTAFAESSNKASAVRGGLGRLGQMATGLVGTLGGPWGLALTAASVGLALFAEHSAEAAADQRSLAASLRDSNGAFDEQARYTLASTDAYQAASAAAENLGISQQRLIEAVTEGGPAFDDLRSELEGIVRQGTVMVDAGGAITKSQTDQAKSAQTLVNRLDELRGMVEGATEEFERASEASDELSGTMRSNAPGAEALREAIGTLGDEVASTADRVSALNDAWRELFGVELSLEEATAQWYESLESLRSTLGDVSSSVNGWSSSLIRADGSIDVTTEAGRELSSVLIEQGENYRELAQTAYDTALKQGASHEQATAAAEAALSEQRSEFIATMRQMGLTADQAETLADRYLAIPDEVRTLIQTPGAAAALSTAQQLINRYNAIPRHIRTVVETAMPMVGSQMALLRMMGGRADGGLIPGYATGGVVDFPSGGLVRGPGGPRTDSIVAAVSAGEYVVNAKATQENLGLLEAINSGEVSMAGASTTSRVSGARMTPALSQGGGGTTIVINAPNYLGTPQELFRAVRQEVSKSYGGDVQRAFGRG